MNKLYKYLPFDIECIWGSNNDTHFAKGKKYSLQELLFSHNNYDYESFVDFIEHNEVKPILRQFEDLIKELPLTKYAAKMVGMKEGNIVKPLDKLTRVSRIEYLLSNKITSKMTERESEFLRAMRFAVDFREDEYIKLEVH